MAKKRQKKKKKGRKKIKKSDKRINSESATSYDVGEECSAIQDYSSDIECHDVMDNLTNESCFAIYEALTKVSALLELIHQELDGAQEEPAYRLSVDQIKNLREL